MFWFSRYFWVASSKVGSGAAVTTGSADAGDASAAGVCGAGSTGVEAASGVGLTAFAFSITSFLILIY
jgi:hypothetical protein